MPLFKTLIATRARKLALATAAAGAVFVLFTLAGVGSATGPLAGSFGTGESILEARYGASAGAAGPGELRRPDLGSQRENAAAKNVGSMSSRQLPKGSRPGVTPTSPLPRVPAQPVAPGRGANPQGTAPSPDSPALPTLETPVVSVPETPLPTPTLPALPALAPPPEVPSIPAVPSLPAAPETLVPSVPGVLP